MLDEKAPMTLYYQLKEMLTEKIKSNDWPVDSKIPTERQLCDMYKVSRITVRKALEDLEREGHLYRKQGKGTYVTAPKIEQRLSKFYSFSEEIEKLGYKPDTKILDFSVIYADEALAKHILTEKGSRLYSIKRLRLANNEPFALETSYLPLDLCPDLKAEDIASGLYISLKNKYGIIPNEAAEAFEAVLINEADAAYLKVRKNSPGLFLERTTKAGERIIEYCSSIIRGDRYKYKVVLK